MRRGREIWLLVFAFIILSLGYWVVWQAYMPAWKVLYPGQQWRVFAALPVTFIAWLLLSLALWRRRCGETLLLPAVALLTGIGLLFLQRLAGGISLAAMQAGFDLAHIGEIAARKGAPALTKTTALLLHCADKQLISFVVGWAALMGIVLFWKNYRTLARYKYLIAIGATALLLVTTVFGSTKGGQTIALDLGPLTFQPHDLVKLLLVVFMAAYLVENRQLFSVAGGRYGILTRMDLRHIGPLVALWLLVMAIIFKHDDLGAAMLLFGALLGMLYLGTERKSYVIIGLLMFIAGAVGAYAISSRVQARVAIWLHPWEYTNNGSYQIVQALMGLGNGRAVGAGLAGGYPERIPAVHTDMIFSAISEDLGLVGAVAVIGLFLFLIGRMYRVALQSDTHFGKLLAAGLATTLALQAWVILAGTMKFIPLTGITLPFISYGGTSLVVNLILLGMILKIAETPASVPSTNG
ncbi:MAG: FtsW/RodA/SpoVE family cell cycle protein [Armatimonadota bacterium]